MYLIPNGYQLSVTNILLKMREIFREVDRSLLARNALRSTEQVPQYRTGTAIQNRYRSTEQVPQYRTGKQRHGHETETHTNERITR